MKKETLIDKYRYVLVVLDDLINRQVLKIGYRTAISVIPKQNHPLDKIRNQREAG